MQIALQLILLLTVLLIHGFLSRNWQFLRPESCVRTQKPFDLEEELMNRLHIVASGGTAAAKNKVMKAPENPCLAGRSSGDDLLLHKQ